MQLFIRKETIKKVAHPLFCSTDSIQTSSDSHSGFSFQSPWACVRFLNLQRNFLTSTMA